GGGGRGGGRAGHGGSSSGPVLFTPANLTEEAVASMTWASATPLGVATTPAPPALYSSATVTSSSNPSTTTPETTPSRRLSRGRSANSFGAGGASATGATSATGGVFPPGVGGGETGGPIRPHSFSAVAAMTAAAVAEGAPVAVTAGTA
ncbi:unnamed protein product, partial [Laminaria digitata]